jgi:hypothetical protein
MTLRNEIPRWKNLKWHVIFIFSSYLRQHLLASEYCRQLPRVYWLATLDSLNQSEQAAMRVVATHTGFLYYHAMKVVRVW